MEHHEEPPGRDSPCAHTASLSFAYADEHRAQIVERSVVVEVGDIDDPRSQARVAREGDAVEVTVEATDLVALRAGINSWTRMVGVAEKVEAGARIGSKDASTTSR